MPLLQPSLVSRGCSFGFGQHFGFGQPPGCLPLPAWTARLSDTHHRTRVINVAKTEMVCKKRAVDLSETKGATRTYTVGCSFDKPVPDEGLSDVT